MTDEISAWDVGRLAAIDPFIEPLPQIRRSQDDETWYENFNRWAENSQDLVDTLHPSRLKLMIAAASKVEIEHRLAMLFTIYQEIDSNETCIEGLKDEIEILQTEVEYLNAHIGKYISEFVFSSPNLVEEYMALEKHARQTTDSDASVAAIMTWHHNWPAGFALLLRIHAVHTCRIEVLEFRRDLITSSRLDYKEFPNPGQALICDDGVWPHGYGYERAPMTKGLADFLPPRMSNIDSDEALEYVRSSAFIRNERRRTALSRLAKRRAGHSDFLAPSYVDAWYHRFLKWLDHNLPLLLTHKPACAKKWLSLRTELTQMHDQWTAEAEYEGQRVLFTKNCRYWLSDNKRVHLDFGNFTLPSKHTPLIYKLVSKA